jgi:hypothetical protein
MAEPDRISVPEGKIERVVNLKDLSLGGYWPGWVSLGPDDSPLLTLDKSTEEIDRFNLRVPLILFGFFRQATGGRKQTSGHFRNERIER